MYAATGGQNVKWGGTDFKWGVGHHCPPPLATDLAAILATSCEAFTPPSLRTLALERIESYFEYYKSQTNNRLVGSDHRTKGESIGYKALR